MANCVDALCNLVQGRVNSSKFVEQGGAISLIHASTHATLLHCIPRRKYETLSKYTSSLEAKADESADSLEAKADESANALEAKADEGTNSLKAKADESA